MIESTFCHLPRISLAEEKNLWRKGLRNWDELLCWAAVYDNDARYRQLQEAIARSRAAVALQNAGLFLRELPESEWFRIYPDFSSQLYYLDIETDGLDDNAAITCVSILNAGTMVSFLETESLESAAETLASVRIAVTFNGTRFDIPRLMQRFPSFYPKFHLDLARILRKREVRGTLRDVASRFGWNQDGDNATINNGKEAAQAWVAFQQSGNRSVVDALRDYTRRDVQMLEFVLRALARKHARASVS
jgi:uncharacterized protein YprB with RNaseH-like and TPR domain